MNECDDGDRNTRHWQRAHELLDDALALPADQRDAWIDALADASAALKDTLHRLVARAVDPATSDFLNRPPRALATLAIGVQDERAGDDVGPYRLLRTLGSGGMGDVWLAERRDGLPRRQVALKLPRGLGLGDFERRMAQERDILASLEHPHIARLYDAGISTDGRPYLALEFVEGQPLDRHAASRQLAAVPRLLLFVQVARAVAYAHAQLVIHRDLKPANVLVDTHDQVKLLDFGIARLLHARSGVPATQVGSRLLTPEYASPEQLRGESLGVASDIYSLGVLLAELLTGVRPYPADRLTPAALEQAIVNGEVRLASQCTSDRKLAAELRGDIDNIIARAMQHDPARRYESAGAMADDVERHLRDEPVLARPIAWSYRAAKFARRHRGAVAASALALAAVLTGVVGTVSQGWRAQENAAQAQRERDRALRQLAHAEAVEELLSLVLSSASSKPFTSVELLERAEQQVQRQFDDDGELRAKLLLTLANLNGQLGERHSTQSLLRQAEAAVQHSSNDVLRAAVECELASDSAEDGMTPVLRQRLDDALARLRGAREVDDSLLAQCLYLRGHHAAQTGDPRQALADFNEALRRLGSPRPGQRSLAVSLRVGLAGAHASLGLVAQAIDELQHALNDLERMGQGRTQMAVTMLNNLGVLHAQAGNPLLAVQTFERGLSMLGEVADAAELRPVTAGNRASSLAALGQAAEAIEELTRSRDHVRRQGQLQEAALHQQLLARAYCLAGELARCEAELVLAREEMGRHVPPGRTSLALNDIIAAELALARNQPAQARAALEQAMAILASSPRRVGMRHTLALMARTELMLGNPAAAATHAAEAVSRERERRVPTIASEWLGQALLAQGLVAQAQQLPQQARAAWQEAERELQASVGAQAPATQEVRRLLQGR